MEIMALLNSLFSCVLQFQNGLLYLKASDVDDGVVKPIVFVRVVFLVLSKFLRFSIFCIVKLNRVFCMYLRALMQKKTKHL